MIVRKYAHLKNKLILSIVISIGITLIPIFVIITVYNYKTVQTHTLESARVLSEKYAAIATSTLKTTLDTAYLTRSALVSLQTAEPRTRRTILRNLIENCLKESSVFFSMWVCYEPNQFDGLDAEYAGTRFHDETGRVVMYFDKDPATQVVTEDMLTDYTVEDWYLNSLSSGKDRQFEPYFSLASTGENILVTTFTVPLKNDDHKTVGVFGIDLMLTSLAEELENLKLYETGYGSLISSSGIIVTHKDKKLIGTVKNNFETIIRNNNRSSLGSDLKINFFENSEDGKKVFEIITPIIINQDFEPWYLLCTVPQSEVYKEINRVTLIITIALIFSIMLIIGILSLIVTKKLRSLSLVTAALRQVIADGKEDLTVRLPVSGNDEITEIAVSFNETIAKIGTAIRTVGENSDMMEKIGNELASNMTETASAMHQIGANIDGVKQQAITQAASVTETASVIEKIVRTIKQLSASIETQTESVAQSSSSIERIVANIAATGQTLAKTDGMIKELTAATGDGKATLVTSNTVTQKIAEESGSLMEASNVIQHIASQTNLLAMNAAIEAAHAGEAGKGFAVVADEIRKLSEDSAMQGKTITATLKSLTGEIETLSASSKIVEEKFNLIFGLAEQVKSMSELLTAAMSEQEHGSKEILSAIKNINTATTEVQTGSEEMLEGGEGAAHEMHTLDELTRIITDSMNEMAAGAGQINNAVQEVNAMTQKNKRSIENLALEVSKFKTK